MTTVSQFRFTLDHYQLETIEVPELKTVRAPQIHTDNAVVLKSGEVSTAVAGKQLYSWMQPNQAQMSQNIVSNDVAPKGAPGRIAVYTARPPLGKKYFLNGFVVPAHITRVCIRAACFVNLGAYTQPHPTNSGLKYVLFDHPIMHFLLYFGGDLQIELIADGERDSTHARTLDYWTLWTWCDMDLDPHFGAYYSKFVYAGQWYDFYDGDWDHQQNVAVYPKKTYMYHEGYLHHVPKEGENSPHLVRL